MPSSGPPTPNFLTSGNNISERSRKWNTVYDKALAELTQHGVDIHTAQKAATQQANGEHGTFGQIELSRQRKDALNPLSPIVPRKKKTLQEETYDQLYQKHLRSGQLPKDAKRMTLEELVQIFPPDLTSTKN